MKDYEAKIKKIKEILAELLDCPIKGKQHQQTDIEVASFRVLQLITEARISELEAFDKWVKDLADDQVYTIVSAFTKTYIENELKGLRGGKSEK